MSKTEQVRVRLEPHVKQEAGEILAALGLTMSDAVSLYMWQIIQHRGLPFDIKLPNKEAREAMDELDHGNGETMAFESFSQSLKD